MRFKIAEELRTDDEMKVQIYLFDAFNLVENQT